MLIYKLAFAGLVIACFRQSALAAAFLLCASYLANELMFIKHPSWVELSYWFKLQSYKDFLIAVILFTRLKTTEIMLALIFIASCLFHHFAKIQVDNNILELKHIRTDFMIYITSAQLATMYLIILTGSGGYGGKRVRLGVFSTYSYIGRFLHSSTFKNQRQP